MNRRVLTWQTRKTAGGKPATAAATGKMIRPETAENAATDASPKSKTTARRAWGRWMSILAETTRTKDHLWLENSFCRVETKRGRPLIRRCYLFFCIDLRSQKSKFTSLQTPIAQNEQSVTVWTSLHDSSIYDH